MNLLFRFVPLALVLALLANFFVWRIILNPHPFWITILPTEAGEAVLVRASDGRTALINAGADASILRALGQALPEWHRTLSAVVLTDTNAAEAGGAASVLQRYRVGVLIRPQTSGSASFEKSLAASVHGTQIRYPRRGDVFTLGRARLEVLWPPNTPGRIVGESGALVVRITYGHTSFLLAGALPRRAAAQEAALDGAREALVIASTTPPGTYFSDGLHLYK